MNDFFKKHLPPRIEQIVKQRLPLRNVNREHSERLSSLQGLAVSIYRLLGTPGFFLGLVAVTLLWTVYHLAALWIPALRPVTPDEWPKFEVWAFGANCLQLFLMPLLLIAQNLQDKHTEARAESDYQVNQRAEREIGYLFAHLEYQNALLQALAEKVGVDMEGLERKLNRRYEPAED